ncbi:MAG: site-specific tyrosine recombinase XerC [Amycolatopsis sp.]|uniref:tyrosine-type recombinase/integrase n=1 Tax=Amycolatopsis sp. TaxID=37632 RepID=UPI0026094D17|nr:tyrosine-type recombinase/integrase [Amycolatopsis sp.]MCU1685338.1 site-specific tyrosine recombinase XerC [Amycolatopsis sp.]
MGRLRLPLGTAGEITTKQIGASWSARCLFRHTNGTYVDIRRRAKTKEAAKEKIRNAIKGLVMRSPGAGLTPYSLFKEVAAAWLAEYRADAENGIFSFTSVDSHTDNLRNHVLPVLGELTIIETGPPVINALCQTKLKAHSLSLAKQIKAVIGNVMTFAVQAGLILTNPVREIAPLSERRAKVKKAAPRSLSRVDLLDFLAKLDADEAANVADLPDLVRGFIATGERRGEMIGADWPDFDEKAAVLNVSGGIIQARGKGTVRNKGKTDNAVRPIALPDWYVTMLVERRERLGLADPTGPIYPNSRGGYLNFQNLTNRHWLPFRRRAGYEWVTFKTLRKTVATLLDDAGLTARQIADVLGHAHPSMTLDVYMGRGQQSRASADALDTLRLGKNGN